jgi:hypothetical protein
MMLLRPAGAAAIIGGALRIADAFLPSIGIDETVLQQAYFVTDLFLIMGAIGLIADSGEALRWPGAIGFVVFLIGILLVRSPQVTFFGAGGYQFGAAIALVGICIIGAAMLVSRVALIAPLMWFGTLLAGALGAVAAPSVMLGIAGLLFGGGFVAIGTKRLVTP